MELDGNIIGGLSLCFLFLGWDALDEGGGRCRARDDMAAEVVLQRVLKQLVSCNRDLSLVSNNPQRQPVA